MSVQPTSLDAYAAIRDRLPECERLVWDALAQCAEPPTAYELFEQMKQAGTATDLNSVRPRLTSLDTRRCIESVGKRPCRITGRTALTWRVKVAHPPIPRESQPHDLNVLRPSVERGRLW